MPRVRGKPIKRRPRRLNPNARQKQRQPEIHRTNEEVEEAIRVSKGNLWEACVRLRLRSPYALRQRINANPVLKEALLDAREELLGIAETQQVKAIKKGEWQARKKVLDDFGEPAGWRRSDEKTVVNVNNSAEKMEVEITWGEGSQDAPEDEG